MKFFQPAALILTIFATAINEGSSRRILQDDPCYLDSPEFDLVWYDLLASFDEWDCSLDFDFFDYCFMYPTEEQTAAAKEACPGQILTYVELEKCTPSENATYRRRWMECVTADCSLDETPEIFSEEAVYPSFECYNGTTAEDPTCCISAVNVQLENDNAPRKAAAGICQPQDSFDDILVTEIFRLEAEVFECEMAHSLLDTTAICTVEYDLSLSPAYEDIKAACTSNVLVEYDSNYECFNAVTGALLTSHKYYNDLLCVTDACTDANLQDLTETVCEIQGYDFEGTAPIQCCRTGYVGENRYENDGVNTACEIWSDENEGIQAFNDAWYELLFTPVTEDTDFPFYMCGPLPDGTASEGGDCTSEVWLQSWTNYTETLAACTEQIFVMDTRVECIDDITGVNNTLVLYDDPFCAESSCSYYDMHRASSYCVQDGSLTCCWESL